MRAEAVLDNPVWAALHGPHAHLAEAHGDAARYRPDVATFHALADPTDVRGWRDLAALTDPGAVILVTGTGPPRPAGWETVDSIPGVQLVDVALRAAADPEAVPLTDRDVPDMLALVRRTEPGPFRERAVELGTYLGIRRDGVLVAMAGERLHPPGWTEISAVCTDSEHRGQGLATRLVRALAAGIRARGETPFLHAAAENTTAIRLYSSIGFALRRETTFGLYRSPA